MRSAKKILLAAGALVLFGHGAYCLCHGLQLPSPAFVLWGGAGFGFLAASRMLIEEADKDA